MAGHIICAYHGNVNDSGPGQPPITESAPETANDGAAAACPKCGKGRARNAASCPRCGLVFDLWVPGQAEARVELDSEGEALWARLSATWTDSTLHETFVKHCLQTGTLAAAGRLYRARIDENPKDALATEMQAQVLSKAALGLSLQRSQPKIAVTRNRWFWVVVLTAMALGITVGLFWRRLH